MCGFTKDRGVGTEMYGIETERIGMWDTLKMTSHTDHDKIFIRKGLNSSLIHFYILINMVRNRGCLGRFIPNWEAVSCSRILLHMFCLKLGHGKPSPFSKMSPSFSTLSYLYDENIEHFRIYFPV